MDHRRSTQGWHSMLAMVLWMLATCSACSAQESYSCFSAAWPRWQRQCCLQLETCMCSGNCLAMSRLATPHELLVDGRCVEMPERCIGARAWFGVASSCKRALGIPSAPEAPPKLRWHSDSVRSSPVWFASFAGTCQHKGAASRSDDIYR